MACWALDTWASTPPWGNIQGMQGHPPKDAPLDVQLGRDGHWRWFFARDGQQYFSDPFDSHRLAMQDYLRFKGESGVEAPY